MFEYLHFCLRASILAYDDDWIYLFSHVSALLMPFCDSFHINDAGIFVILGRNFAAFLW